MDILNATEAWVVKGVTDPTANTALSTKPPNPFKSAKCFVVVSGRGCYVYDDGAGNDRPSGITKDTIDIRSTGTSQPFQAYVFPLGMSDERVRDHTATTT